MLKAMVAGQPVENHNDMYCSPYDYYPADFYPQPQEMCPAHPHMCAVHGDYGPVTVPMVSTNSSPPIAMPVQVPPGHVVQQIVDESGTLRHVILSPQAMLPMPPPYGPGPGTSSNQPHQPFFAPQGLPPSFHTPHYGNPLQPGVMSHVPPSATTAQQGHSPPPLNFHKDERTHRQYIKLKKKLEQKQLRTENFIVGSSQVTPPTSPRKELVNGMRRSKERGMSSVGTSEDGEESSSVQDDDDDFHVISEILSTVKPPQVAELNSRSALMQWSPPERLADSGLEGKTEFDISESDLRYEVLLSDKAKEGKYKMIYSGPSLSCRIQDLRPGTEYSVCVAVSLDDLKGSVSIPTTFRTPPCEPEQPLPPKLISRSRTSLLLRWSPTGDNGSHITHYILEYDEGKGGGFVEAYKNRGKQHNMLKLQPSTCYRFRLAAVNEYGKGPYSDIVQFSTSGSPPTAPASPVLKEATVSSLHLAWQKRPNDVEFCLQMDDLVSGHGFRPVYNGPETHYVQDRLYRHTEYKFRLCAHNEEGNSRWSDEVCYRTLPGRPAVPSRPSVKGRIHTHTFKIKWEPPSDTGGAEITAYTVELNGGRGFERVYTGPELEYVCDRLMPGTTYQARVSCSSAGGCSDYSEPCIVTTEAVCPGQCSPPRLHGKARATSLALKWSDPEYDGGSPLTDFEVELTQADSTKCMVYRGKEAECVVSELSPGQLYVFQVRAFNRVGPGPWSDPLEVLSGAAPPETPSPPQVNCRSSQHVFVHWLEPVSNGATITDYRLEMSQSDNENEFCTVFQGLANSCHIKELVPATPYYFRLQASNSAGWSGFSDSTLAVTPPSSPSAVSLPRYTATPLTISLTWQQPDCHGAEILHYNIDLGDRVVTTCGPVLEHTLEGLQPETTYRIRIQAVNSVGPGPFCPVLRASTLPLPPAPPKLECVGTGHNYLKFKWGDGKNLDFTQYILEMENSWSKEFQCVYQGASHSYKVNRLQELTTYRFRIAASNDAGLGDFSDVVEHTTSRAPPPALKAPKTTEIQQRSCLVEWNSCKPIGADPVIYQVQLARVRDQDYKQVYRGPETKLQLNDLEPGTDYCVRVCPVRQANSGDLPGPYSPPGTFSTVAPEPVASQTPKSSSLQVSERKALTDQQWAMIILCGFGFFSVLVAVIMQQAIHWSKDHT
ncbi:fibronectin type-III domain-containing protein 3A isoform X1 [Schistocerca cancellata]|uniref:fibronectin type-III domain-containing protein 3A isoform X1 n=2 Tax=Schistocerca cancellata TaxID=274614 RepID=UPI00211816EF|nr:fibronectin type-III domain-containing protein 3A isoform X1 [Schistocerca cancellata]XP_049774285.1 fibronectin type-III domain-containing protein 3A isoform X1 [Schistocerca cancellata]